MNLRIPGFGLPETTGSGETMEWKREKARKAIENKTEDMASPEEDDGRSTRYRENNQEKELDNGFGV